MGKSISDNKTFEIAKDISSSVKEESTSSEVNNIVVETCRKNKITLETLIQKLDKLSKAQKITYDKMGDEHAEEDSLIQHKAILTLLELIGYLKKGPIVSVEVGVSSEEREIIDMYGRYGN